MENRLWPANSEEEWLLCKMLFKRTHIGIREEFCATLILQSFCFGTIYLRQALSIIPTEQKETLKLNKLVL